jgi:predicted nucleic acid-binding protein
MIPSMATINLTGYQIKMSDQFFFDTNVWLLLFGTVANYQKADQASYSNLLQDLIRRDKPIYITSMILSEFANVLLRHDFKQWVTTNGLINQDFKRDFVGTIDYQNSVLTIKQLISSILNIPNIVKVSDSFHNTDTTTILGNFGIVDFNDSYITQLSNLNSYKVVTNDRDFQKLGAIIDILTTQI